MEAIAKIEKAARRENLSYGQYVSKYLTRNTPPPAQKACKRIRQYGMDGNLIAEYDSVSAAATAVKTGRHNLMAALRGDNHSSMGYQWRYADDLAAVQKKESIYQYTAAGELVGVYETMTAAERASGNCNVSRAIAKGYKAGGYYWRRK